MANQKELWFGIDPGLVRTGVICATPDTVLEYATYSAGRGPDFSRAIGLAQAVLEFILQCHYTHGEAGECNVRVAIELPIYKRNAKTLIKQIRLFEEIESQLFGLSGEFKSCKVYEISPTQAKKAATGYGTATKGDIIAACPESLRVELDSCSRDDAEAIGDAWAHYRAGITGRFENYFDMTTLAIDLPVQHERTL